MGDKPLHQVIVVRSEEEHKARHKLLQHQLDELMADYYSCTGLWPSKITAMELAEWNYKQTEKPDPPLRRMP